ncbi:Crp/Fnr family transcriptional regulator [Candidatus Gracilibacteria bacterium]|nr:Crp/Fnr family transcriptional regulator [Candidatus Gracilibacteria bacterium]
MAASENEATRQRELWARLDAQGMQQVFRRNSYIFTPNQPAHALYLLHAGQVSLQMHSADDRLLTLRVVEPGEIFGHSTLAGLPTFDGFAESLKTVRATAVPRAAVAAVLRSDPSLSQPMIAVLGDHYRVVSRRLDEVAFKSVPARLASILLDMAQTTEDATESRVPRRTHQQLAEMINAYRETVTKVINQFRDARLLDIDRSGITLLNPSRLRELAQS